MKPVIGHSGVGKSRSDNPHHGRRKIQSDLFDRLALGDMNHFKHLYDVFRLRATYHGHKGTSATMSRTVSDNSIQFSAVQRSLVNTKAGTYVLFEQDIF